MKKKHIGILIDFIIIAVCLVATYFLIEYFNSGYYYFYNLYNTVEQSDILLSNAYWYETLIMLSVNVSGIVIIGLMLVKDAALKLVNKKYIIICTSILCVWLSLTLVLNLLIAGNIYVHLALKITNCLMLISFSFSYAVYTYCVINQISIKGFNNNHEK